RLPGRFRESTNKPEPRDCEVSLQATRHVRKADRWTFALRTERRQRPPAAGPEPIACDRARARCPASRRTEPLRPRRECEGHAKAVSAPEKTARRHARREEWPRRLKFPAQDRTRTGDGRGWRRGFARLPSRR